MSLVKRLFLTITVVASLLILATLYAAQGHRLTTAYANHTPVRNRIGTKALGRHQVEAELEPLLQMPVNFDRVNTIANRSIYYELGANAQQVKGEYTTPILGIEVSQTKPFFMQAATRLQRRASAVIRVSSAEVKGSMHDSVSAIKLEPILEKGKVRVNVFVVYGDTQGLQRCKDLDALKTVKVDSLLVGPDKEGSVTKLRKYGVKMEKDPFTFRVVSRRMFVPGGDLGGVGEPDSCPCVQCERATCCPNPGYCSRCECVTVCCRN